MVSNPLDELTLGLGKLKVSGGIPISKERKDIETSKTSLTILSRGSLVPQWSLIELKTRSNLRADDIDWEDTYPQPLISRASNMFICIHNRGTFEYFNRKSLLEIEAMPEAKKTREGLTLLRRTLGAIQDVVLAIGDGARLSLVYKKGERYITVYERKGKEELLVEEILGLFEC